MRKVVFALACSLPLFLACQKTGQECDCASRQYIHKYGFHLTEKEWKEREKDGQIVTRLKNGITITNNYAEGLLQGASTVTYSHSPIVQKRYEYDLGDLIKCTLYDPQGIPMEEVSFEGDNRKTLTFWNEKGVPLSIEEYEEGLLLEGQYFNQKHELEATIEEGVGTRLHRDHKGLLLSKDSFKDGKLASRTTFHPDGRVALSLTYQDYKPHGKHLSYAPNGDLFLERNWENGVLQGPVISYFNGKKVREIPYVKGEKEGIEKQFNDQDSLIAEIHWNKDQKHGSSHYYQNENTQIQWFFHDEAVSLREFEKLDLHEKMIAGLDE
jgi:antitoxin component YwqK of YwqJK toxin-antitoxin module